MMTVAKKGKRVALNQIYFGSSAMRKTGAPAKSYFVGWGTVGCLHNPKGGV